MGNSRATLWVSHLLPSGWRCRIPGHAEDVKIGKKRTTFFSPTYQSWRSMMQRCYSEYKRTEDRNAYNKNLGLKVCYRWATSFEKFLEDMGERPEGMTLDRIDPQGDYTVMNCRWADAKTQASNRNKAA